MRFRKKPVEIDALQLRWDTWDRMCTFAGVGRLDEGKPEGCYIAMDGSASDIAIEVPPFGTEPSHGASAIIGMKIPTLEGLMVARQGDWIIRGVKGELYPCKPDIFEATYERVHDPDCAFPHKFTESPCPSGIGNMSGPMKTAAGRDHIDFITGKRTVDE